MDIMLPYNAWRLLYIGSGGDAVAVRRWQEEAVAGTLKLPVRLMDWWQQRLKLERVSNDDTLAAIDTIYKR